MIKNLKKGLPELLQMEIPSLVTFIENKSCIPINKTFTDS